MYCIQFSRILERQPDGPLPAEAVIHLDTCADCHLLWADLNAIRSAARELDAAEPASPAVFGTRYTRKLVGGHSGG